jgi:anti-sigma28 factor (negative regulator of flagellin synthesis)
MSIRIDHQSLPGTGVSELSRAEEISRSGKGGSKISTGASQQSGDQVQISSLSGGITETLSAIDARQSNKVQHLAALYASGRYKVDSAQISHAMVAQSVTAPAAKSGE